MDNTAERLKCISRAAASNSTSRLGRCVPSVFKTGRPSPTSWQYRHPPAKQTSHSENGRVSMMEALGWWGRTPFQHLVVSILKSRKKVRYFPLHQVKSKPFFQRNLSKK
jgi:hypothetical protein